METGSRPREPLPLDPRYQVLEKHLIDGEGLTVEMIAARGYQHGIEGGHDVDELTPPTRGDRHRMRTGIEGSTESPPQVSVPLNIALSVDRGRSRGI